MAQQTLPLRGKWVGARVKRVEDPRLLTGEGRYVADITLPRLAHVAFLRSPHAHARIKRIDTSRAIQMPGVLAVITGKDLTAKPLTDIVPDPDLRKTPQPILPTDKVRFVGEPVAAVVAESRYLAEDAVEQLVAEYEPLPAVVDLDQAMSGQAPLLFEDLGTNVVYRKTTTIGEVDRVFREADRVFSGAYYTSRSMAAPMETRGCCAQYERAAGRMTIWSSTQTPHLLRSSLAGILDFPEQKLRVIAPEVGGAFGQKMSVYPEDVVVAALARRLARPVRWIEDRRENLMAASHGKGELIRLEAAVKADGTLLALKSCCIGDAGAYNFNPVSILVEPICAAGLMPGVYRLEHYQHEVIGVLTNKMPVGTYRGVGWTPGHSARELLFDEIARELGLDPAELRRKNMIRAEEFPYQSCTGMLYDSGTFLESMDRALAAIDYDRLRAEQRELRKQGRYLGIGISPYVEPTGFGSEASIQGALPLPSHDNARVSIDTSGKVTVAISVSAHGQGHETSFAQLAADILGVDLEDVVVLHGDTDVAPFGMGSFASRSAVIAGGCVTLAAQEVRAKVLRVAGELLEASPADLLIERGNVFVRGAPQRSRTLSDVALAAYYSLGVRSEDVEPLLSATRFHDCRATYSNGCIVAVAEVDAGTGIVKLQRIVAAEDCGTILNPMIVEGQVSGAVAQGIGGALHEDLVYDEHGQLLTTTYMDYLLPTTTEVPQIDVEHLETPSPFTIGGIKGMGESGMIATPAAVAGAVIDALSPFEPKVRVLPLTPDRILRIVQRKEA